MIRGRKSQGLNNDCDCIADRGAGRQTLVLARVSLHFLTHFCWSKIGFEFSGPHRREMLHSMETHKRLHPMQVRLLGPDAVVLAPNTIPYLIQ